MRALLVSLLLATAALAQQGGQTRLLQLQFGADRRDTGNLQAIEAGMCPGSNRAVCTNVQTVVNVQGGPLGAPGDGSDQTVVLRSMLKQPNTHFYFPAGTYLFSPQPGNDPMLSLATGTTIECAPGAVFKYADNSLDGGNRGRMISNMDGAGNVTPVSHVTIRGCTFDGNCRGNPGHCGGLPPTLPVTELVAILRAHDVHLEDNLFEDVPYIGVSFYTGEDIHFDHNSVFSLGQQLNSDAVQCNGCQNFTMNSNILLNVGEGLVAQSSTATAQKEGNGAVKTEDSDGTINDNVVDILPANGICQGVGIPFPCCTGEKTGTSANVCAAGISGGGSILVLGQRITISGNTLNHANTINIEGGRNFETHDIDVVGNTSVNGTANCFAAFVVNTAGLPTEYDIHDVHFVGNLCDGVTAPGTLGSAFWIAAGLTGSVYNITMIANTILHPSFNAFYMQYQEASGTGQISNIDIQSNHVLDVCKGFAGTSCGAVYMNDNTSPAFDRVSIKNNYMKDTTKYLLWEEGTQTHQRIEDNDFLMPSGAGLGLFNTVFTATVELWKGNFTDNTNPFVSASTPTFSTPLFGKFISDDVFPFATIGVNKALFDVADGSRFFCSDCTVGTPCTGSGNGAWADRIHGAWDCHL